MAAAATRPQDIMKDPVFQEICLGILERIQTEVYNTYAPYGYKFAPGDIKFFLKGGNAATMLLHEDPDTSYDFTSDFDMTLLIDPAKYSDELFIKYFILMLAITFQAVNVGYDRDYSLDSLNVSPSTNKTYYMDVWAKIIPRIYEKYGLKPQTVDQVKQVVKDEFIIHEIKKDKDEHYLNNAAFEGRPANVYKRITTEIDEKELINRYIFANPIRRYAIVNWPSLYTPIQHKLHATLDISGLIYRDFWREYDKGSQPIDPSLFRMNTGTPFDIVVTPDIIYKHSSIGITLITIRTKTDPPVDIIDIAIPRRGYKLYDMEWDMAKGNLIMTDGLIAANEIFSYFDQQIAAAMNTRPEKVAVRRARAERLHAMIAKDDDRLPRMIEIFKKYTAGRIGGYRPTARNLNYLRKWKKGVSIGFTMRSSLKAKGLIPRSNGTYKVSLKYKKRI